MLADAVIASYHDPVGGMREDVAAVQRSVMLALVECDHPDELAPRILRAIGEGLRWDVAALWTVEGSFLVSRSQWRAPSVASALVDATRSMQLRRNQGLPGIAWACGEPVWQPDVLGDARFICASAARLDNLRAALVIPLHGARGVVGVLELFRSRRARPSYIDELVAIGRAIAVYFEKHAERSALETALRFSQDKLARLHASELLGLGVCDTTGGLIEANDRFLAILQRTRAELEAGEIRWDEMTAAESRAADQAAMEELKTTGAARGFEKEFIRSDGTRVPVLIGCAALDAAATRMIAFVFDTSRLTT